MAIEKNLAHVDNRFTLVIAASKRARPSGAETGNETLQTCYDSLR